LKEALKSTDADVRDFAADVLKKINAEEMPTPPLSDEETGSSPLKNIAAVEVVPGHKERKASSPISDDDAILAVESQVAALESEGLEGDFGGISYVSGMTAISEVFNYALEQRNVDPDNAEIILFRPVYGGTDSLKGLDDCQDCNEFKTAKRQH